MGEINKTRAYQSGLTLASSAARALGQIAIPALVKQFSGLELAAGPQWQLMIFIRGLRSLFVNMPGYRVPDSWLAAGITIRCIQWAIPPENEIKSRYSSSREVTIQWRVERS